MDINIKFKYLKIEIPHHMRNGPISSMTNCEIMGNFVKIFHAQRQNLPAFIIFKFTISLVNYGH